MAKKNYAALPKWAQYEINKLQSDLNRLNALLDEMAGERPESEVYIELLARNQKIYLDPYASVAFIGNHGNKVRVQRGHKGQGVRIDIDRGVIIPVARNAFTVLDETNKDQL